MNNNIEKYNKAYISGEVASAPTFAHETYGEKFYEFTVNVPRLSGTMDVLPVTISERILPKELTIGAPIHALGQFRSYNKIVDGRSRRMLTVFIRELLPEPINTNTNAIALAGYICKKPAYRITPFNREIADLLIAVNRGYNKSDYIPAIAWGRNAKFAEDLQIGERIVLSGRIQSREYQKKQPDGSSKTMTAYEVSISRLMTSEDDRELNLWESIDGQD